MQCAHIRPRRYSAIRCILENAWCLCRDCHREVDTNDRARSELIGETIGWLAYDELIAQAEWWTREVGRMDWGEELARLNSLRKGGAAS